MKSRINCWEFMKCGREINGERAKDLGVCAAAANPQADGINGGINGGRICWALVGTYSCHAGKSLFSEKKNLCFDCEFHRRVLSEEGILDLEIKKKVRKKRSS
ncbi:MAG TPA: hypothetical protein VFG09_12800 [Thermodesulfovibrionales bacterium]|nr:hypothetical protein [Thermodesulfovibrionales bacterium]